MKKKIKDLTLEECFKMISCCKENYYSCRIENCPFAKYESCLFFSEIYDDKDEEIKLK